MTKPKLAAAAKPRARVSAKSDGSRFAHFAGANLMSTSAAPAAPRRSEITPSPAMRQAALRREMVNGAPVAAKPDRPLNGADAVARARQLGVIR